MVGFSPEGWAGAAKAPGGSSSASPSSRQVAAQRQKLPSARRAARKDHLGVGATVRGSARVIDARDPEVPSERGPVYSGQMRVTSPPLGGFHLSGQSLTCENAHGFQAGGRRLVNSRRSPV